MIQVSKPEPRIMRYELTDHEWSAIKPMLPNKVRGVPRVNDRRVLNAIFWVLRSGAMLKRVAIGVVSVGAPSPQSSFCSRTLPSDCRTVEFTCHCLFREKYPAIPPAARQPPSNINNRNRLHRGPSLSAKLNSIPTIVAARAACDCPKITPTTSGAPILIRNSAPRRTCPASMGSRPLTFCKGFSPRSCSVRCASHLTIGGYLCACVTYPAPILPAR